MHFHYDTAYMYIIYFYYIHSRHYALSLRLLVPLPEAGFISQMGTKDGGIGLAKPHNL